MTRSRFQQRAICLLGLALAASTASADDETSPPSPLVTLSPPGQLDSRPAVFANDAAPEIWKSRCEMCHGSDGAAQTAIGRKNHAKNLSDPKWQRSFSDDQIRWVIRRGVAETKMRGFEPKMSDPQLEGLVTLIRSLDLSKHSPTP